MRKYFGVVLILLMTVPFLTMYLWVKTEQYAVKKHVKRSIMNNSSKEELLKMDFFYCDTTKLNWKHSKEFEMNGEMYDIVYREYDTDKVTYYVWHDVKETNINKRLVKLYRSNFYNSENNSNQNLCFQLLLKGWLFETYYETEFIEFISLQNDIFMNQMAIPSSGFILEVDQPPVV
jgi:hypothetical protein